MRFYRNDNSRFLWPIPRLGCTLLLQVLWFLSRYRRVGQFTLCGLETLPHHDSLTCMDLLMGLLPLATLIFFVDCRSAQFFYFYFLFFFYFYFLFFYFFIFFLSLNKFFFVLYVSGNSKLPLVVNVLSLFVFVCLYPPCFVRLPGKFLPGGGYCND